MSPTAEQIAWLFVSQYFKRLHSDPSELHHFYDVEAKLLHGKEQDDAVAVSGTQNIQERISQLHTKGCKTLISSLDAMEGPNNSILIQIIGQMSSDDDQVPQKFVQSVVLESKSGTNYSIYSDVFRFLKEYDEEAEEKVEDVEEVAEKEQVVENEEPEEETNQEVEEESKEDEKPKEEEEEVAVPKEEPKQKEQPKKEESKKKEVAKKETPKETIAVKEAPVETPAAPVTNENVEPAKPSGPLSWADRMRSADASKSATAAAVTAPPAAPANTSADSPSPVSASATPVPTNSSVAKKDAAGNKKAYYSAYIKNVDATTDTKAVEAALRKIGNGITHFEVSSKKTGIFVDFADPQTLRKALEIREIKIGNSSVIIDERKRRKAGSGSSNGASPASGGGSGNRDSNKRQGPKRR